jgi:hypothetical protein
MIHADPILGWISEDHNESAQTALNAWLDCGLRIAD